MQNCLSRICLNRKLFIISCLGYPLLITTDNSSANEQLNQQEDTTVHIIDILDNLSITNNCFFIITSQLRDLKIKLKSPIYDINTIKETLKEYDIDLISIERNIYHVKDISLECLPFISLKRFIFVSKQILNFIK